MTAPVVYGPAYRRRMRSLRSSWRQEQLSLHMQAATMDHHSFQCARRVDQGVQVGARWVHDFEISEPSDDSAVIEYVALEPAVTHTEPAPVIEHVPPIFPETVEMVRLAPHGQAQPQTVEHVLQNFPATVETASFTPVLVIAHVTSSVNGFIAPTPPVTFPTPCQQVPACTMPAVTTSSVHSSCPTTVVDASASRVVGSLPFLDEFAAPVHQKQHTAEQVVHVCGGCQCDPSGTFLSRLWNKSSASLFLRLWRIQSK